MGRGRAGGNPRGRRGRAAGAYPATPATPAPPAAERARPRVRTALGDGRVLLQRVVRRGGPGGSAGGGGGSGGEEPRRGFLVFFFLFVAPGSVRTDTVHRPAGARPSAGAAVGPRLRTAGLTLGVPRA